MVFKANKYVYVAYLVQLPQTEPSILFIIFFSLKNFGTCILSDHHKDNRPTEEEAPLLKMLASQAYKYLGNSYELNTICNIN